MKAKKQKNGIKVLLSLVIAITMIGIPASVFTPTAGAADGVQVVSIDVDSLSGDQNAGADPYGTTELLNESFDSWPPSGWTIGTGWSQDTTTPHTGTGAAERDDSSIAPYTPYGGTTQYARICTTVDATGMTGVTLTYWIASGNGVGVTGQVEVNGNVVDTFSTDDTRWQQLTVDLTAYAGTTFTLCFNYTDNPPDDILLLDDVVVVGDNHPTGIDIAVNDLVNLTCGGRYNTAPRYIEASVANYGQEDATNVPFHFQIYQERPLELERYKLWDMESCILRSWETIDNDGDGAGWYWTEKRSYSPTHSWHTSPDNVPTYEANSDDSLILKNWFHVNSTVGDNTVSAAYLTFAQWCEGEFDGTYPVDYGMVYIHYDSDGDGVEDGVDAVSDPIYDTEGKWQYLHNITGDDQAISLSAYIGMDIKIEFRWFSDYTVNNEGWYIDDVNIDYSYNSLQPLVWSDYQYIDLAAGEEEVIKSQLPWGTIEDGYNYYIEVYFANNVSSYVDDPNPLNNWINCSVWFGDVCDAAVDDVAVNDDILLDHEVGVVSIPINVTVRNNGTLTEDIPVTVKAQHLITDTMFKDDMEGDVSIDEYSTGDFGIGTSLWHIGDYDFYSPYNSFAFMDDTNHYGAGYDSYLVYPDGYVDWSAVEHDHNFDITQMMKWNLNPLDNVYVCVAAGNYVVSLSSSGSHNIGYPASMPWTKMSITQWLTDAGYINAYPGDQETLGEFGRYICDAFGFTYPDDFHGYGFMVFGSAYGDDTHGLTTGTWSGVLIDDVNIQTQYAGATVWTSDTQTINLEPGATGYLNFTWNATEYCDYMITATSSLACDIDPNNDEASATTRIHEWAYQDSYETNATDDNTYGLPDDWNIQTLCSICPDNHFWWNGVDNGDGTYSYASNADDVLIVDKVFNFTEDNWYNLSFDVLANIWDNQPNDVWWDYGLVEVSNDSGLNWYPIETLYGMDDWTTLTYNLYNPFGTGLLDAPHYYEVLGAVYYGYTPLECPAVGKTDEMMFRFHMLSDGSGEGKGLFIDNVEITNATDTLFFDDIESGDANWKHMKEPTGNLWHDEGTYWECADTYASWYDAHLEGCSWGDYWNDPVYSVAADGYYRNNMDDKLILTFDLTHSYQAILHFEQNYSFAGMYPDDYGVVEIWTGSEWKALFIVQGDTGGSWAPMTLDISDYVGGSDLTQIRFHFISNDTITGEGWKLRNFSIDGKVDYKAPTCTASLSPETADGNNGWYKSSVTVTLTADDNVKMGTIYYRINGGSWLVYTAPFTISNDGSYVIDYYAVDSVGNEGAHGSVSFKIDATAPTASISSPQAGYIYFFGRELMPRLLFKDKALIIGGLNAEATASDSTSGVYVVKFNEDGTTFAEDTSSPYSAPLPFALFAAHTLTVTAEDFAGNTYTTPGVDYFKIF